MAIQLGSAYGKVSLDIKGLLSAITQGKAGMQTLAQAGENIGAGMKRAGQAMTIGLTLPILAAGAASIKAASDLEETRNKVKVVFGDMSDSVLEWSKDSAKAFGMSKQQALEAAGTFGNLFTSMGLNKGPAADMSQGLVQLAADLASFNNIDPSIVLEKLRSGLVGEVEPLRTLGINLTMAQTKAKAMEMGLADASGEISQAALLQARYALILEQSTNAQGDFARTSDGLANSTRIMNAQWKDTLATLGANLLPLALKLVGALNSMLQAFNNMSPFQQKVVIGFLAMVAAMGPVLMVLGTVISFISSLVGLASGLAGMGITLTGIGTAVGTVGTAIMTTLVPAIGALLIEFLPIILIIAAIVLAIGILHTIWKKNLFGIQDATHKFVADFKAGWKVFTDWLSTSTQTASENMRAGFSRGFDNMFKGISTGWNNFMNWLRNVLNQARTFLATAFSNVNWGTVGKNILMGIANGMLLGIPNLIIVATRVAMAALNTIKNKLGIHSESTVFKQLGKFSGQGYQTGLSLGMDPNEIARTMARPVNNMMNTQQQNVTMNFASGLTLKDVRGMIAANNEQLMTTMIGALSG